MSKFSHCECGNSKGTRAIACARCVFLDGRGVAEFEVIQLLRETGGGLTVLTIATEVRQEERNLRGVLRRLERKGRLVRHLDEGGGGREEKRGAKAYVYQLVERGAA